MGNIGEAIGLAGVVKPPDTVDEFAKGFEIGDKITQRKTEKEQKRRALLEKAQRIKPGAFASKALADKASKMHTDYMMGVWDKYEKDPNSLYSPQAQQEAADFDWNIQNLQAEDAQYKDLDKGVKAGTTLADPDYLNIHRQGTYDQLSGYNNKLLKQGFDPTTSRSNVSGVRKYSLPDLADKYLPDALFDVVGEKKKTYGRGFQYPTTVSEENLQKAVGTIALAEPEVIKGIYINDRDEVLKRGQAAISQAQARGEEINEDLAYEAAARQILGEQLRAAKPQKLRLDETDRPFKETGSGEKSALSKQREKWVLTPAMRTLPAELVMTDAPFKGVVGGVKNEKVPFVSIQNIASQADNPDVFTLANKTVRPLGFIKNEGKLYLIGREKFTDDEEKKSTREVPIDLTDEAELARVAGAMGYEDIDEFQTFIDSKFKGKTKTTESTAKANKPTVLTGKINPSQLKSGSSYSVGGKNYKWNGTKLIPE